MPQLDSDKEKKPDHSKTATAAVTPGQTSSSREAAIKTHSAPSSPAQATELVGEQFKVGKRIGSGSYGQVRLGTNVHTGQSVAIKFESIRPQKEPQLQMESRIYHALKGKKGFPDIYFFGRHGPDQYVLVMQLLERNLETLYECCKRNFSLKSIVFLTLQLLKRFEQIHAANIVYRDVKPENFMLGPITNTIFIIDFGLSKPFIDPGTGEHIANVQTNGLIGTSRYMSMNAHQYRELSRRDDLEALAYVFLYFLRGKLPWSGLKASGLRQHNQKILDMKRDIPVDELCAGFPEEYQCYLRYARALTFDQTPNYNRLRNMFKRLFQQQHFQDDGIYDWNTDSTRQ